MFDMVPFRKNNLNSFFPRSDYFDQMFNSFFDNDMLAAAGRHNSFKVDVKETNDSVLIEADLPGVKKDAIDLTYDNNYLTITAHRKEETDNNDENMVRRERYYGEFQRSFYLDNVNQDQIKAAFQDGVLRIVIPKETPQKLSKKIDIE